jgi:hypothetical protein
MNEDNSQVRDSLQAHTKRVDWFVKGIVEELEGCIVASIVRQEDSIHDLHMTGLPPDCYRTQLCWGCVHAFDMTDTDRDSFVCKKHLEFYEDQYAAQVRFRNIQRYHRGPSIDE